MSPELDFMEDGSPVDSDKFVFSLQKERKLLEIISNIVQKGINKTPFKIQSLFDNLIDKFIDEGIKK